MKPKAKLRELIEDYSLIDSKGNKVTLSSLFGTKEDLILIHNMGRECPMCTMWADGFNGVLQHLEDRAAFVVVSPDDPVTYRRFADTRGWKFRTLSAEGTPFTKDMGFGTNEDPSPGVSVFHKKDGKIYRVAKDDFGPGDPYCIVWHFFDLLPNGGKGLHPKFKY